LSTYLIMFINKTKRWLWYTKQFQRSGWYFIKKKAHFATAQSNW